MTFDDFDKKILLFKSEISEIIKSAPFVEAQNLQGQMLSRVFVKGKDSNNMEIGKYVGADSKSKGRYKTKRSDAGRRIDTVDLQFTGALFESIKTGTEGDFAIIGFNNTKLSNIGRYNEARYKKEIFAPTEQEQQSTKELMNKYIAEQIRIKFKQVFGNGK